VEELFTARSTTNQTSPTRPDRLPDTGKERAMAIALDRPGMGGYIHTGDHVDVIAGSTSTTA
jgi:Flp pilus assembly protein CpaB